MFATRALSALEPAWARSVDEVDALGDVLAAHGARRAGGLRWKLRRS
jgi:hypothetical protein